MIRRSILIVAAAAVCALVAACSTESDDDAPPAVTSAPTQGAAAQDVAAQSTPCSYTRPRGVADTRQTITSHGAKREYLLHVPATYPPSYDGLAPAPAPLLIVFHGAGVPAQSIIDLTAITAASDERGMVTVFPEAIDSIWTPLGSPPPTADADFAANVIADVATKLCIDRHRVYGAGFSLGGSVAQLVGCTRADLVAAVASVASPAVSCQGEVPLIAVHGDADPIAPYEGRAASAPGEVALRAVPEAVAAWAGGLGCGATPAISQVAADVELAAYSGCAGGGEDALLFTVLGGGHAWPGATFDFPREITGFTTHSVSANELLLEFFEAQRR